MKKLLSKFIYLSKKVIIVLKRKRVVPVLKTIDSNKILKGRVALVVGGNGGIGFGIAKSFIKSGCKVIISGTNEKKLKDCCSKLGDNSKYILLDLNQVNKFELKIKEASKFFGNIDILVNSAGIHSTKKIQNFLSVSEEEYNDILQINLKGVYFLCQKMGDYMIKNKIRGHILNISSSCESEPAWSPYRISKWGLKGLTFGLAQQLISHGIVVNAIAPGSTATSLLGYKEGDSIFTNENRKNRYIMPEEIAEYAKLLVSDLGEMVIGDTIYISGGRGTIDIR